MKKYKIEVGDWSKDGHNQSDIFFVECNMNPGSNDGDWANNDNSPNTPYSKGSIKVGFDLINKVCNDYEDRSISNEYVDKVVELYPKLLDEIALEKNDDDETHNVCDAEAWLNLYLIICKIGDSEFKYKIVEESKDCTLTIGGYGLYN